MRERYCSLCQPGEQVPAGTSNRAENLKRVMAKVGSGGLDAVRCVKGKTRLGEISLSISGCWVCIFAKVTLSAPPLESCALT